MNPIINPIYIYLIGIVTPLNIILLFIWIISLIISAILGFDYLCDETPNIAEDRTLVLKICKTFFITFIISLILYILIPNKETIIGMLIAQNVTVDRVNITTQVIKTTFDSILTAISK